MSATGAKSHAQRRRRAQKPNTLSKYIHLQAEENLPPQTDASKRVLLYTLVI
jgi:hypothetical protein